MARRHNVVIAGLRVEIELHRIFQNKAESEEAASTGKGLDRKRKAYKRVILTTPTELSERQRTALQNTIKFCPVGRMFSGGDIDFTNEFIVEKVDQPQ